MAATAPTGLKRDLSSRELFALAFGAIVGVSWIVLVGQWITDAGPLGAMLAFLIGGLLMLPLGVCYAELGQRYPATGGELVYAFQFFGSGAAFVAAWILALLYLAVCAFEAVSTAWLAAAIWPSAKGPLLYHVGATPIHLGDILVGAALTAALCAIQLKGAQLAAKVQDLLVALMVGLAALFLLASLWSGNAANLAPAFGSFHGFMTLLLATPLFFAGFNAIPQALGESSEAARSKVTPVVVAVILASMVFKIGVILATGLVLTGPEAARAEVPVALAFERAFGSPWLSLAALATGLMGLVTTWNSAFYAGTRVLFALGNARLGPTVLGRVGVVSRVPFVSILIVAAVTFAAVPWGRQIMLPVISLGGVCVTSMLVLVSACLWKGRARDGGGLGLPILCAVISVGLLGLMFRELIVAALAGDLIESLVVLVWAGLGAIIWIATKRERLGISDPERGSLILGLEQPA